MIVTKVWGDDGNAGNTRPETITVNLYRKAATELVYALNSLPYRSAAMSGNRDIWTYTFTGLPAMENGVRYDYLVLEVPVPGYRTTYANNGPQSWTINNTLDRTPTATPFATATIPAGGGTIARQPVGMRLIDGEWVYLDEYDTPLGVIPGTGDNSSWLLWIGAAVVPLLGIGIAVADVRRRKKKSARAVHRNRGM